MVILLLEQQPILIQAIFTGDVEEVRAVLEFKHDVNYQDCEKRSPLHAAAFKGSADIAALLLSYGARVNTKDNRWITPLHRACCCGSADLVTLLLRYQADTTARDRQWQTPLHVAAANCAVECVEQLLECVPNCNVTDRMGRTALHHAAVNGHNDVLEILLSKGCIVNACDKKDCRPIHCASHMGHVDSIDLLLRNGADINAKDRNQYSPLHVAASSGMVSACRVLLRAGAEVDARNAYGNTPLHIACLNGHLPVCNVLMSFNANIEATNYRGQTPLHIAAASTHGVDCLNFLVEQKANINKQSIDGRSPLHMTAIHGRFTRSKTLIDRGAIVDCTDKNTCTALHIAAQYGHDILSNTLLGYGADPSKKGYSGRTPLHMSCLAGYVECCRKFLQAGVSLNAVDDSGKTPIHCAAYKGSVECLDLLVSNGADFQLMDNIGRTPLHYAAVQGHYPCVFTLVGLGSNVNLCDLEGCSPLHLAAAYDIKGDCVEYLLRHKSDPKLKDNKGFTPIHYAVTGGNLSGLGFLLSAVGNNYIMYGSDMPLTTPLHLAARNGNHDILQLLLSYFHDVNIRTEKGSTALLLAAKAGNTHCVQMLLRYGAKVAITDAIQHMGPVHYSARNGHMHCLALLLDNAEDNKVIDMPDSLERTALMLSVAGGHTDSALTLLKCGADSNIVDVEKHSSLFRAVVNGQQNTVQLLLSNGAVVNKSDIHGKTVLHLAAASGHLSSLQIVINSMDSDIIMALDNQGCTALHWACYNGSPNCVLFLLEKNVFKELEGNVFSPIHCATFVGAERCIELLCNYYGTDIVKLKDARNRTPLHIAALHGHVDCAKFLLEKGAEIDCKDADDRTPLVAAAQNGQSQIIDILLSYKADVTSYDNNGNTALHLACLKRHSHSALLLLENINDIDVINMINNDKKTPLHLSARNGLVNVTRQLISKGSSVLAVDANGMTPALCCAPNSSVAQCLALILANYAICSQQNKEISIYTSSSSVKRITSSNELQLHKKTKTYQTQNSQTDISLLRDPDYFECQRMCRRHCNSPSRIKKKRLPDTPGSKMKKNHFRSDLPTSALQTFYNERNYEGFKKFIKQVTPPTPIKNDFFILENYKSEDKIKQSKDPKFGRDLHHTYSDMLIAQNIDPKTLETFNKLVRLNKTKKNLKAGDFRSLHAENVTDRNVQQFTNLATKNPARADLFVKSQEELQNQLKLFARPKDTTQTLTSDSSTPPPVTEQDNRLDKIFEETMNEIMQQKRFLQSNKPKVATKLEQNIRENRTQNIWKTNGPEFSREKFRAMIELQQQKELQNMQYFQKKPVGNTSRNSSSNGAPNVKTSELNNHDGHKTSSSAAVEDIFMNSCNNPLEMMPKLNVFPVSNPKLKIIETANDDEVVKVDQVIQREHHLEELELEKLHSSSKKLRDKPQCSKQTIIYSHMDKSSQNFIREGLKIMKSNKNLQGLSQHVHMLNSALNKRTRNIPLAIEIMKHILATIHEREWLEKQNNQLRDLINKKESGNIVAVELFDEIHWDDIYNTTEELAFEMQVLGQMKTIEIQDKNGKEEDSCKIKLEGARNEEDKGTMATQNDVISDNLIKNICGNSNEANIEENSIEINESNDGIEEESLNIQASSDPEDENYELCFVDENCLKIDRRNCYSDTTVSKLPTLTAFHAEPTEITSVMEINETETSDEPNENLYDYYSQEPKPDNMEIAIRQDSASESDETISQDPQIPNMYMSGTISLVCHLSVQKEMEMTLESIDAIFDKDAIKSRQIEEEPMDSIKTLYINENEDQDDSKEAVVEDESSGEQEELNVVCDEAQDDGKLIQELNDEKNIVLEESDSNNALSDETCVKSGKKNLNIVKKKRLKSRENLQCCVS